MGLFTKEEKYNWKEGKFETTKKGVKLPFKGPEEGTLEAEAKKFERQRKKKKTKKRKNQYQTISKNINKALDWVEGKPAPKKHKTRKKPQRKRYVVKNGVAYPVYRSTHKTSSKPKTTRPKRKNMDYAGFNPDFDLFGTPTKKGKKKKKKQKDPFDFKINW